VAGIFTLRSEKNDKRQWQTFICARIMYHRKKKWKKGRFKKIFGTLGKKSECLYTDSYNNIVVSTPERKRRGDMLKPCYLRGVPLTFLIGLKKKNNNNNNHLPVPLSSIPFATTVDCYSTTSNIIS
jgi:hypothetical protein